MQNAVSDQGLHYLSLNHTENDYTSVENFNLRRKSGLVLSDPSALDDVVHRTYSPDRLLGT